MHSFGKDSRWQTRFIKPESMDDYYVYCLRRPCGEPFYIGKGRGYRVNAHFRDCILKLHDYKSRIIKKHGKYECFREIIAYFENEDDAFELEEFLIAQIGIVAEGGPLANFRKSTWDPTFYTESGEHTTSQRPTKFSDEDVVDIYKMWYEDCVPNVVIREFFGISKGHLIGLVRGSSRCNLWEEYVGSGEIKDNRSNVDYKILAPDNRDAEVERKLIEMYPRYIEGEVFIKDVSDYVGLSGSHILEIFQGEHREYLGFDSKKDRRKKKKKIVYDESAVKSFYDAGADYQDFVNLFGCSSGYFSHIAKRYGPRPFDVPGFRGRRVKKKRFNTDNAENA